MYDKCGNIEDACSISDEFPHCDVMILGYAIYGFDMEALKIFDQMKQYGIDPYCIIFVGVLSARCHAGLVDKGWHFFKCIRDCYQITPTMWIYGCMVDFLGRAGTSSANIPLERKSLGSPSTNYQENDMIRSKVDNTHPVQPVLVKQCH
ncbi:hypothetical protein SUGI_0047010 [Cryptomeria japonica]|nr:hypothetical protein SUGI_0047010 [Cryptomeria japonica]